MPKDLKQEILQNKFIEKLRNELVVDTGAFESLCRSLRNLELEWKGVSTIDKALAQELYVLATVTQNMSTVLAGTQPDIARELTKAAIELDALVINCLS